MNRAASRMMARDPLISTSGLRFLLMADVTAREFLAGFRLRRSGECLALSTPSAWHLPVARKSRVHGGMGDVFSSRHGKVLLTYRTSHLSYIEEVVYDGPDCGQPDIRLTLWEQRLPDIVVAALPGRRLADLLGVDHGLFLAARTSTITRAAQIVYPGSTALRLSLDTPWHRLARASRWLG